MDDSVNFKVDVITEPDISLQDFKHAMILHNVKESCANVLFIKYKVLESIAS